MILGSKMWPQPQLERTSVVKSRWEWGLKVWNIQEQHIRGRFSTGKWLVWMEPKSGMLSLVNHGVNTHRSHTHSSFVRFPMAHCQLLPGWNPNAKNRALVLCQVLPASDHYLVSYFQLSLADWFSTWSPGWALRHKSNQIIHYIICILQRLLSAYSKSKSCSFLASCFAN